MCRYKEHGGRTAVPMYEGLSKLSLDRYCTHHNKCAISAASGGRFCNISDFLLQRWFCELALWTDQAQTDSLVRWLAPCCSLLAEQLLKSESIM
jgi:hypothetical protein